MAKFDTGTISHLLNSWDTTQVAPTTPENGATAAAAADTPISICSGQVTPASDGAPATPTRGLLAQAATKLSTVAAEAASAVFVMQLVEKLGVEQMRAQFDSLELGELGLNRLQGYSPSMSDSEFVQLLHDKATDTINASLFGLQYNTGYVGVAFKPTKLEQLAASVNKLLRADVELVKLIKDKKRCFNSAEDYNVFLNIATKFNRPVVHVEGRPPGSDPTDDINKAAAAMGVPFAVAFQRLCSDAAGAEQLKDCARRLWLHGFALSALMFHHSLGMGDGSEEQLEQQRKAVAHVQEQFRCASDIYASAAAGITTLAPAPASPSADAAVAAAPARPNSAFIPSGTQDEAALQAELQRTEACLQSAAAISTTPTGAPILQPLRSRSAHLDDLTVGISSPTGSFNSCCCSSLGSLSTSSSMYSVTSVASSCASFSSAAEFDSDEEKDEQGAQSASNSLGSLKAATTTAADHEAASTKPASSAAAKKSNISSNSNLGMLGVLLIGIFLGVLLNTAVTSAAASAAMANGWRAAAPTVEAYTTAATLFSTVTFISTHTTSLLSLTPFISSPPDIAVLPAALAASSAVHHHWSSFANHLVATGLGGGWAATTSSSSPVTTFTAAVTPSSNNTAASATGMMCQAASPALLPMLLQSPTISTAAFAICCAHRHPTSSWTDLVQQVAATAPNICPVSSSDAQLRLLLQQVAVAEAAVGPTCPFNPDAAFSKLLTEVAAAEAVVGPMCAYYPDHESALSHMLLEVAAAEAAWVANPPPRSRCEVCQLLRQPMTTLQTFLTPERLASALAFAVPLEAAVVAYATLVLDMLVGV